MHGIGETRGPAGHRIEVHSTTLIDRLRHSAEHPWDGLVIERDAITIAEKAAAAKEA